MTPNVKPWNGTCVNFLFRYWSCSGMTSSRMHFTCFKQIFLDNVLLLSCVLAMHINLKYLTSVTNEPYKIQIISFHRPQFPPSLRSKAHHIHKYYKIIHTDMNPPAHTVTIIFVLLMEYFSVERITIQILYMETHPYNFPALMISLTVNDYYFNAGILSKFEPMKIDMIFRVVCYVNVCYWYFRRCRM